MEWAECHFLVLDDSWLPDCMITRQSGLQTLIEPAVTLAGHELVGVEVIQQGLDSLLRIYIDNEAGITVEDCARVSRQVSGVLDVADPISGHYTLEVSSPGLDRPLFTAAHYDQFVGYQVSIALHRPFEGRRKLNGELAGLEGSSVRLLENEDEWLIPLEMVRLARLVPVI
jgi:ribosome maturation factor RimP